MKKIFPISFDSSESDKAYYKIHQKLFEKRRVIFGRISMIITTCLIGIALYLLSKIYLDFSGKEQQYFNTLFFILFLAVGGVIFSFFMRELSQIDLTINREKKIYDNIKESLTNREKYRSLERYSRALKYDSILDDNYIANYDRVIEKIKEYKEEINKMEVSQELNYIFYILFHGDNNGFHTPDILDKIEESEDIKILLNYVLTVLRYGDVNIGIVNKTEEEAERFFVAIKKNLEKRYETLLKVEEREKIKKETQEKNIDKMKEELID